MLAFCLNAQVAAQYRGGPGDGSTYRLSVQLRLDGIPAGVRALYSGGTGDGHDRLSYTAVLEGTALSVLFAGGSGDGFDRGGSSLSLNGTELAGLYLGGSGDGFDRESVSLVISGERLDALFAGGPGDGFDRAGTGTTLGGTSLTVVFGGGPGDGYADLRNNVTLDGTPLLAIFGGGAGDGHDEIVLTAVLNGVDLSAIYRGGTGQGFFAAEYFGTVPLPLTLVSFSAIPDGDFVLVKWVTEDEVGTDYFTIERTGDGRTFADVGTQLAAGNSEPGARLHYELLDEEPLSGTSFYRLRTTDFDGAVSLSHLVEVNFSGEEDWSFTLFPNPGTGQHFSVRTGGIDEGDELTIEIFDVSGRQLLQQQYEHVSTDSRRFDLGERLSTGSYLIRLRHARRGSLSKILLVQ